MDILLLDEKRCRCGKLLFKGFLFDGVLEVKCKRCGEISKIGATNLVDDATHYLLIANKNGIITNGSEAACYVLGYEYQDLIGKHLSEIGPITNEEINGKFFGPKSLLNDEKCFREDTFHISKSGKEIPIVASLKLFSPAKGEKYLLISAMPKNIKTKDNFLKIDKADLSKNTCDFYFSLDKKGVVEYASSSAENIFKLSKEDFIGKNYFNFLSNKKGLSAKNIFNYFSIDGEPFRATGDLQPANNGKTVASEVYFTPKFNDMGKLTGYHAFSWIEKKKSKI